MKREDAYYHAMLARDPRFDGKFFVGVKTTGIYCRPICPAKPKRQNVEFFPSSLAAEKAGYRPCLRCRPESAPASPAWIGKSAVVRRALKSLQSGDVLDFNEDLFAAKFGVTARHLRRLFNEEIGKTPKRIAFEARLNMARKLIVETALPLTQIAMSSGFGSVRRFNSSFQDRFKRTPSQLRRAKARDDDSLKLSLSYRPPFDFEGLLHFYRSHQTGDLETFFDGGMRRVVEFDGRVGTIEIRNDAINSRLDLTVIFPDAAKLPLILNRVRAMFDLDSDPVVIANAIEIDPKLKSIFKNHLGIRLPSGWDGFEVGVAAILGQLVSVERGRALVSDLIEMLGKDSGLRTEGRAIKLFPTPKAIASSALEGLKTTSIRKQTLIEFARTVESGKLSLEPAQDIEEFNKRVLNIRGIGPWTASYMALKVLRHADAFPETDLILARALKIHAPETIAKTSPWQGYVAALLWREYSATLKKGNTK